MSLGQNGRMRSLLAGSLALVLLAGVGCSSNDDEPSPPASTTSTSVHILSPEEIDASRSDYCRAWRDIREAGGVTPTGDVAADTAARKAHYSTKVVPLAEELLEVAPRAIRGDVRKALAQVREVAETGSDAPFYVPGAAELRDRLADYALENCAK
jgi:hypothetical protein